MSLRLAVVGVGAVGRSVVELAPDYGHVVTAVADSRSSAVDPDGIDADATFERKEREGVVGSGDPADALAAEYDVLVEATPTTLGDAEPGFSHVRAALERDRHVVLANKGPVAERYADLRALEAESDRSASVASVLDSIRRSVSERSVSTMSPTSRRVNSSP